MAVGYCLRMVSSLLSFSAGKKARWFVVIAWFVAIFAIFGANIPGKFSDAENMAMTAAVNAARADVLWVGMTAPKQEQWLHAQWPQLEVRVAGAIGAVFDFYAGRIKRSHPLFQRLGLEWLPRLLQEPRRLWRRTFVSTPRFLWDVWRFGIRKRQPPP